MDAVAALFSGFVCGAAVGVLGLGILGPLLVTVPATNRLRRAFPDPSNWVMVSLGIALVGQAGCAVLGMILGAVLLSVEPAASGLGSPSWTFTTAVVATIGGFAIAAIAWQPAITRRVVLLALLAAGSFGWMLPHLASA